MNTFLAVKLLIEKTYHSMWRDWFSDLSAVESPAFLRVYLNDDDEAGYYEEKDIICIPICSGNLSDGDILNINEWPIWRRDLVHEILHEYQSKHLHMPSDVGTDLCSQYGKWFPGKGHDALFFTAIAEKASYFEMSGEQLIHKINSFEVSVFLNGPASEQ